MMKAVTASLIAGLLSLASGAEAQKSATPAAAGHTLLVIHGGGGVRLKAEMTPQQEAAYRADLAKALQAGHAVLKDGGTSIVAVEAAIRVMEDSPLFNAGKGASYTIAGTHQLDSSIMDGKTLKAGSVAVVEGVKNPITLSRTVMEKSPHVLMAGPGALEFAKANGLEIMPPHYFHTDRKWESLQRRLRRSTPYGRTDESDSAAPPKISATPAIDREAFGTVGAVALDKEGNLAAGTSTGGREGKLIGRVGDSAIIGAGTYANNATLAVSSTGLGEYVQRVVGGKAMSDMIEYRGLSLGQATQAVVDQIKSMGGGIGVVAINRAGEVAMPYSGDGMYRGTIGDDGKAVVLIYDR